MNDELDTLRACAQRALRAHSVVYARARHPRGASSGSWSDVLAIRALIRDLASLTVAGVDLDVLDLLRDLGLDEDMSCIALGAGLTVAETHDLANPGPDPDNEPDWDILRLQCALRGMPDLATDPDADPTQPWPATPTPIPAQTGLPRPA